MASWLGHSKIHFDAAERTIPIPLLSSPLIKAQTNDDSDLSTDSTTGGTNTQSFLDLCKQTTPPCHLNPLLFNGHLQTMWTAIKGADIPITYKRKIFESKSVAYGDGGSFAVDFVVPTPKSAHHEHVKDDPTQELPPRTTYYTEEEFSDLGGDDSKPLLIMLHGLAGGSHEIYLRTVLKPLCLDAASDEERWEALVVNARGCAHSRITSGVLYNARATWDVRQVVQWARTKWPKRKLFGMGFSLGANILTNVRRFHSVYSFELMVHRHRGLQMDGASQVQRVHDILRLFLQQGSESESFFSIVVQKLRSQISWTDSFRPLKHQNGSIFERVRNPSSAVMNFSAYPHLPDSLSFIKQSRPSTESPTNFSQYIGEEGAACPLDAAVVISNPWNLDVANVAMQSTYLGLHVYSKAMGDSMRELFLRYVSSYFKSSLRRVGKP